jgi:hypothetical protein
MGSSAEFGHAGPADPEHEVLRLWAIKQVWGGRVIFAGLGLASASWVLANVTPWFFPVVALLSYLTFVGLIRWLDLQRQYLRVFAEAQSRTGLPSWTRVRPGAYLNQRGVYLDPDEVSDPVLRLMRRAPAGVIAGVGLVASLVRLIVLLRQ